MHNLTKIKLFRILLCMSYPLALIFIFPFILFKRKNPTGLFFFFDRYAIGGAQRIHIDILQSVAEINKQVYFTRSSPDDYLKKEFYSIANTHSKDIHFWCDNLLIRLFTVHYYSLYINRHSKGHVFSSNSTFFYDMLFFLKKSVVKTELLHNFTHGKNGMEFFGLANHKLLNYRVVYDIFTLSNIKNQYISYGIDSKYTDRILFIEPGVSFVPFGKKDYSLPLKVLYAGRGGPQKRIYLLNAIAEKCIEQKLPISFHFAGTMQDELSPLVKQNAVLHGEISEKEKMYALYQDCHIILMTSAYEGFPMIIKEGMANGCLPVVTALEGNKTHLTHQQNALLIEKPEDEEGVVAQAVSYITMLCNDNGLLHNLSATAHNYARQHFDRTVFLQKYLAFFNSTGIATDCN
ncbi:hypothetical protein CAP35_05005 [Chitinophagaceae bacterium IBVUCB1]|nr:hypothetical protein CAP35_05005 [Chitinophagaceae bacterium IBVUCB1]